MRVKSLELKVDSRDRCMGALFSPFTTHDSLLTIPHSRLPIHLTSVKPAVIVCILVTAFLQKGPFFLWNSFCTRRCAETGEGSGKLLLLGDKHSNLCGKPVNGCGFPADWVWMKNWPKKFSGARNQPLYSLPPHRR